MRHLKRLIQLKLQPLARFVKNVIKYKQFLFSDDRDFDFSYLYLIMYHKLERMERYFLGSKSWKMQNDPEMMALTEAKEICYNLGKDLYTFDKHDEKVARLAEILKQYSLCWWD